MSPGAKMAIASGVIDIIPSLSLVPPPSPKHPLHIYNVGSYVRRIETLVVIMH